MLHRRRLLTIAAAAVAAPLAPRRVWAGSTLTLGDRRVDTLSDGSLVLPGDFILGGMPQDEMRAIIARYGLSPDVLTPPCNVTLMRDGDRTILFDTGSGPDFQPTAGKLAEALAALDLTAEDITHVVFTHGHPDHLWGLLDEFDEPVFANAEHLMSRAEFDYWLDPDTVATIGEARVTFAVGSARRLRTMADRIRLFEDGEEVLPGVIARATFGHSPGHMAFILHGGGASAMVTGDALGNHHVAFERPDWPSGQDQDRDRAAAMRPALLDQIVAEGMTIIGYHLPDGGIGRAERAGGAYRFVAGA
jgi:glyoxylase-like metal-dependent hydrolase (beta-lactamase superfamily II)